MAFRHSNGDLKRLSVQIICHDINTRSSPFNTSVINTIENIQTKPLSHLGISFTS